MNVSVDEVTQKVKKVIAEQLGLHIEEVKDDASFLNDLGADSLDIVEMVMTLEEEFNMDISDEEAEKIQTVRDAIQYIVVKIGKNA